MKPILKDLATEYAGKATIMSVDVDKSSKLIDYFGVGSVPDSSVIVGIENNEYIYMKEDGKVSKDRFQARILGLRNKQEFEKVLDLAIQKGNVKST
jgi:thioredoxin 1